MKDTKDVLTEHGLRRRKFVEKTTKVAATAPAVALLLSQATVPAHAGISGQTSTPPPTMMTTNIF